MFFFPISPANSTKSPRHYIQNKHKTRKDPEKQYSSMFPGFSFCLIYPRFGAEGVSKTEMPIRGDQGGKKKKSQHKPLFLQPKAISLARHKTLGKKHSSPVKTTGKAVAQPSSMSAKTVWGPEQPTLQDTDREAALSNFCSVSGNYTGNINFHSHQVETSSQSSSALGQCQRRI